LLRNCTKICSQEYLDIDNVQPKTFACYCGDQKSRAACAHSFAPWQQEKLKIMLAISLTIACSRYVYNGVILHAHPVRGESHNQRNVNGEVATLLMANLAKY